MIDPKDLEVLVGKTVRIYYDDQLFGGVRDELVRVLSVRWVAEMEDNETSARVVALTIHPSTGGLRTWYIGGEITRRNTAGELEELPDTELVSSSDDYVGVMRKL